MTKKRKVIKVEDAIETAQRMINEEQIREEVEREKSNKAPRWVFVEKDILKGRIKAWERFLLADLAESNACGCFHDPEEETLSAYGREKDLDGVEKLYRFVYSQVVDACNKFSKTNPSRKALGAFRLGVIDSIGEALDRAHEDAPEGLKELDPKDVDKAVEKLADVLEEALEWGLSQVEEEDEVSFTPKHESFQDGRKAGRDISISLEEDEE